ncbi:MAG: choice-of-anchor E domain-containing protein [Hydrococcus sp. Prado102]|jgi:hypothetical protein|nr:choice-of-anchor E domain-containing protein [Hydrococcus sp. Prado102]
MKNLALGTLVVGFLIGASSAQAATLEFTDFIEMQNTDWGDEQPLTLEVSRFNSRLGTLRSVFVEVSSDAIGTYTLSATGRSNIRYGLTADDVGASVTITGPSNSIELNPTPNKDIGSGTLLGSATPRLRGSTTINISGSDTKSAFIDSQFFNLFTGAGNVVFEAFAGSNIVVSKQGSPFNEVANIQADARLRVVYEYDAPPPPPTEIPEPGTLAGLLAFGSLGLAANRRRAS